MQITKLAKQGKYKVQIELDGEYAFFSLCEGDKTPWVGRRR